MECPSLLACESRPWWLPGALALDIVDGQGNLRHLERDDSDQWLAASTSPWVFLASLPALNSRSTPTPRSMRSGTVMGLSLCPQHRLLFRRETARVDPVVLTILFAFRSSSLDEADTAQWGHLLTIAPYATANFG